MSGDPYVPKKGGNWRDDDDRYYEEQGDDDDEDNQDSWRGENGNSRDDDDDEEDKGKKEIPDEDSEREGSDTDSDGEETKRAAGYVDEYDDENSAEEDATAEDVRREHQPDEGSSSQHGEDLEPETVPLPDDTHGEGFSYAQDDATSPKLPDNAYDGGTWPIDESAVSSDLGTYEGYKENPGEVSPKGKTFQESYRDSGRKPPGPVRLQSVWGPPGGEKSRWRHPYLFTVESSVIGEDTNPDSYWFYPTAKAAEDGREVTYFDKSVRKEREGDLSVRPTWVWFRDTEVTKTDPGSWRIKVGNTASLTWNEFLTKYKLRR